MKTTVIYHSADYDGIFCREIARKFLPEAELVGWNFGDPKVIVSSETLYVLDLSPECFIWAPHHQPRQENLIWIDHHKTSIERWPASTAGYRIDGVAACRLAWQWFSTEGNVQQAENLPVKADYVNRAVREPLAVRLAGEYDIWDKRHDWVDKLQFGLCVVEPNWPLLLEDPASVASDEHLLDIVNAGEIAQRYAQQTDASTCKNRTWLMEWEGLCFLCLNSARFNSLSFAARDLPETGHDALLGFCFDGKCWTVSLYHAKHRTNLDLSEIAKRHSGGGHRGACGFTASTLPFNLGAPTNERP